MTTTTEYKYTLQKYQGRRTRHTCPQCGKAGEFTRYVDEEGQEIAAHVGKCNRLDNCGFHYTPAQFFQDHPRLEDGEAWKQSDLWKTAYTPPIAEAPPAYLPRAVMERTLKAYGQNNFLRYLTRLFGEEKALSLARLFCLGTSKRWTNAGGYSVIFWQIDRAGNVRQAKVMAYNPETGRRLKADGKSFVAFLGKRIAGPDANLSQCLFGEHLLSQRPAAPVALVESEKTAIVMSALMPDAVWLATGGKHGARWTEKNIYSALEGRKVILYPDLGAFGEWQEKGKVLATVCDVSTSDILERKAAPQDRQAGFDIADYFTKALQDAAQAPAPGVEPVQATETAFISPQGEGQAPAAPTAHQQEETATTGPEQTQDEKRRAVWKKWAKYYILKGIMSKSAQAQRAALGWKLLQGEGGIMNEAITKN